MHKLNTPTIQQLFGTCCIVHPDFSITTTGCDVAIVAKIASISGRQLDCCQFAYSCP